MEIRELRPTLTWRAAHAALEETERLGLAVAVAVGDSAGVTAAHARMPRTPFHCASIAEHNGYTAAACRLATAGWAEVMATLSTAVQAGRRARPRFVTCGGRLPTFAGSDPLGGIGVSGASKGRTRRLRAPGSAR